MRTSGYQTVNLRNDNSRIAAKAGAGADLAIKFSRSETRASCQLVELLPNGDLMVVVDNQRMARKLTEREMRQVDRWAQRTDLAKMLDFFQSFSTPIWIPRPVLLGSNNENEIWIQGYMPGRRAIESIRRLDEPYNPHVPLKKTLVTEKRPEPLPGTPFKGLYEVMRKGLTRTCLLRSLCGCRGRIVRSHSIQKAVLSRYATEDGRVYHFDPLRRPHEGVRLRLMGVNRATTFTAFCEHHDRTIFRPIEAIPFENRADQAFLFHYRAFAWTYYDRAHRTDILKAMHADLSPRVGQGEVAWLAERIGLNLIDLRELDQTKQRYETILKTGKTDQLVFRAFRTRRAPGIACAEFFAPHKDLFGTAIQNGKQIVHPMYWISLTILPVPDGGLVIIGSENQNDVFDSFVNSIALGTSACRTARLLSLVFGMTENFIILPFWWRSLSGTQQKRIVDLCSAGYFPRSLNIPVDLNFA